MITKTKIETRKNRKTNLYLVETINVAKKNNQLELAKKLSMPTRKQAKINLSTLNEIKENKILIPGKVLGSGEINKKFYLVALSFSEQAKEKLKKSGCEIKTIKEELKINPKLEGVNIL